MKEEEGSLPPNSSSSGLRKKKGKRKGGKKKREKGEVTYRLYSHSHPPSNLIHCKNRRGRERKDEGGGGIKNESRPP